MHHVSTDLQAWKDASKLLRGGRQHVAKYIKNPPHDQVVEADVAEKESQGKEELPEMKHRRSENHLGHLLSAGGNENKTSLTYSYNQSIWVA